MITPVVFCSPVNTIVDQFNQRNRIDKSGKYWEDAEVDAVRKVIKDHYILEQDFKCCYCSAQINSTHGRNWDVEHIVPKSSSPHFLFEPKNLAVSCIDCNTAKGEKMTLVRQRVNYPTDSNSFKIVHPHFDQVDNHIGIIGGIIYFPKTEKGSSTIEFCGMMRYSYQHLDRLYSLGNDDMLDQKFSEMMAAQGDDRKFKKMEILIMLQIGLSRSLLPAAS